MKLTVKQRMLLEILVDSPSGHSNPKSAAFELQTSEGAAGRIMSNLIKLGLACRNTNLKGDLNWWITEKGRTILKEAAKCQPSIP